MMNRAVAVIILTLAILINQSIAQEQQAQKETNPTRAVKIQNKYDKMEKKQLQMELKRLVKDAPDSMQAYMQAEKDRKEEERVYESATEEKKSDALLRMLEAEARLQKLFYKNKQLETDFNHAKSAYRNLVYKELK